MSNPIIGPASNDRHDLPAIWLDAAATAARNLGVDKRLDNLSPEHWQRVLVNVEAKMRMRGVEVPEGWQVVLAQQVGRHP